MKTFKAYFKKEIMESKRQYKIHNTFSRDNCICNFNPGYVKVTSENIGTAT